MSTGGQLLGGVGGAIVGFFASGGNPLGALYGAQIGLTAGGYIDPPKGPNLQGPRLSDLSQQVATYGAPIPRCYGTIATHGNMFWIQNDKLIEVAKKKKSGGKGGPETSTTTYSYYASFAVGICKGPITGIRRIWIRDNLFYDAGSDDLGTIIASNQAAEGFTVYLGTDDQEPDPLIQADRGVDDTPAYRGLAYLVFERLPLKEYGNSLLATQVKIEIYQGTSDGLRKIIDKTIVNQSTYNWTWYDGSNPSYPTPASGKESPENIVNLGSGVLRLPDGNTTIIWADEAENVTKYDRPAAPYLTYDGLGTGGKIHLPSEAIHLGKVAGLNVFWQYQGTSSPNWWMIVWGVEIVYISARYWTEGLYCHGASIDVVNDRLILFLEDDDGNKYMRYYPERVNFSHNLSMPSVTFPATGTQRTYTLNYLNANTVSGQICFDKDIAWKFDNGSSTLSLYSHDGEGLFTLLDSISFTSITTNARTSIAFSGIHINIARSKIYIHTATDNAIIQEIDLSEIIEQESSISNIIQTGLSDNDIDVSDITDSVRGYKISSIASIRAALSPLQAAYPFDIVQSGYTIKFVRRGNTSVATIPVADLGVTNDDSVTPDQIIVSREMDSQLPSRVSLRYLDVAREYGLNEQFAERVKSTVNIEEIEMPLALNASEAAQMSETLLYMRWLERYDVGPFTLPPDYIDLEPADVITVVTEDASYELRLISVFYKNDGSLECKAKFNSAAIYLSTKEGEEGLPPSQTIGLAGPAQYHLLDIPVMDTAQDAAGFNLAMGGYLEGWGGGALFNSLDEGQTWDLLQSISDGAIMGSASNSLSVKPSSVIDAASILNVFVNGELESVTLLQMLNGANHFAYGADGRWEIIAAMNCVQQGDDSWNLSNLLRGRFGTEWAASQHAVGDVVVKLDVNTLAFMIMNQDIIGSARDYRGVSIGANVDSVETESFTYNGENLKPLSPVYLNGNRHPSTRDWTLTWLRRTRTGGAWRDYVDASLGEASESYQIDIYNNSGYGSVVRTISISSATATYTSAQQVTDFGGNQGTLYLDIFQVSAIVGRGRALRTSITRG